MIKARLNGLGAIMNIPTETQTHYSDEPVFVPPSGGLPGPTTGSGMPLPNPIPGGDPVRSIPPKGPPLSTCRIPQLPNGVQIGTCVGVDDMDNPICNPNTPDHWVPLRSMLSANNQINAARNAFRAANGYDPTEYDYTPPRGMVASTLSVNRPIYKYLLFSDDPIPKELTLPEHAPFGPDDPRAKAFAGAMQLFFPLGFFEFGGSHPGRLKSDMIRGSYIRQSNGSWFPYAYWYPMVSEQMVQLAVSFMKAGGFGAEAGDVQQNFVAAGAQIGSALKSLYQSGVKAEDIFTAMGTVGVLATASSAVPVIGTAVAAGLTLFSVFSNLFDDPDPPAWLLRLKPMGDLALKTGGLYWIGPVPPGGNPLYGNPPVSCNRFWSIKKAKYTVLQAYQEVMCRLATGKSCAPSEVPWSLLGVGLAIAAAGGLAIYSMKGK